MIGRQANIKKNSKDLDNFVNTETGETLTSEVGVITSINTRDEDFVIIDGEDFMIVERGALNYLETILTPSEMNYVRLMTTMVRGEYNVLHSKEQQALTRKTLQDEMDVAKTTFVKLMSKLHKEGVINYIDSYISKGKKVKYVMMNPTLARKSKRIRVETARMFRDLRKENI